MKTLKQRKVLANKFQFFSIICFILALFFIFVNNQSKANQIPVDSNGETHIAKEKFIQTIAPFAIELNDAYGVLPSITIGQAVLESNFGQSQLASKYNNLFGVKAYGDQRKISLSTQEYVNEEWITIEGDFVIYDSWEESMIAHSKLFVNGVTWDSNLYQKVLESNDYKTAAQEVQNAGYATDPTYADKLINIIEQYKLYKYDK